MKLNSTVMARVCCLVAASSCAGGCLSRQAVRDGDQFRKALVAMYTDQAMDNLMRAHDYEPFIQLKYRDLLNDDTDTLTGNAKLTQTLTQTTPLAVAALAGFTRDLANFWTVNGFADRKRQMSLMADPVTTENDVYEAYLCFARDERLFRVTCDGFKECDAHIWRKKDGKYYWVPKESGEAFLHLVLSTSMERGPSKDVPSYYDRSILTVENVKALGTEGFSADITLVKGKELPNGNGTLVVLLENNRKVAVRALMNPAEKEGSPVTWLSVQVPNEIPLTVENLRGANVRFYSDLFPPESPAPPVDLNPVLRSLERIRQELSVKPVP